MKKILLTVVLFLFLAIISIVGYLVIFGYETNKFNSLLENKIKSSLSNVTVNIEKIKVKINIKNLNFFITTSEPRIKYRGNAIGIKRVDYIELLNTKNFSKHINSNKKFNIFIAFYINKIRLIDNF